MCCDYSVDVYKSRKAVAGEDLVLRKFPSGSMGFVAPEHAGESYAYGTLGEDTCAVCCKDGVELLLEVSGYFTSKKITGDGDLFAPEELTGETAVTFYSEPVNNSNRYLHRDGVILPNGRLLSLQLLPHGTKAHVIKALPDEIVSAANGYVAFKEEVKVEPVEMPARGFLAALAEVRGGSSY